MEKLGGARAPGKQLFKAHGITSQPAKWPALSFIGLCLGNDCLCTLCIRLPSMYRPAAACQEFGLTPLGCRDNEQRAGGVEQDRTQLLVCLDLAVFCKYKVEARGD